MTHEAGAAGVVGAAVPVDAGDNCQTASVVHLYSADDQPRGHAPPQTNQSPLTLSKRTNYTIHDRTPEGPVHTIHPSLTLDCVHS